MTSPDVEVDRVDDVVFVRLRGDVDMTGTPTISAHVLDAVTGDVSGVVVDVSEVRYLDSAGVQMLFDFLRRLEASRKAMAVVVGDNQGLRRLLDITHVDAAAAIADTRDDAVAAVRAGARRAY